MLTKTIDLTTNFSQLNLQYFTWHTPQQIPKKTTHAIYTSTESTLSLLCHMDRQD